MHTHTHAHTCTHTHTHTHTELRLSHGCSGNLKVNGLKGMKQFGWKFCTLHLMSNVEILSWLAKQTNRSDYKNWCISYWNGSIITTMVIITTMKSEIPVLLFLFKNKLQNKQKNAHCTMRWLQCGCWCSYKTEQESHIRLFIHIIQRKQFSYLFWQSSNPHQFVAYWLTGIINQWRRTGKKL